jgi:hypothetical protein
MDGLGPCLATPRGRPALPSGRRTFDCVVVHVLRARLEFVILINRKTHAQVDENERTDKGR